jgi:PAS domain S-box-containing protein
VTKDVHDTTQGVILRETQDPQGDPSLAACRSNAVGDSPYSTFAFLRGVIDADPTPIFVKDREGRYVFVNHAVADVFGKSVGEMLGLTDAQLALHSAEAAAVRRVDCEVMNSGREVHTTHERLSDSTGRVRWWETWKRPLRSPDGGCDHVLGVAVDRTRQVEIEQELRRNKEELEQRVAERTRELTAANERLAREIQERLQAEEQARTRQEELAHVMRLTTMGELAAEIAHEVNQPLAAIFNYTQGCLRRLQSGSWRADELTSVLTSVAAQATLAANVIRRLRDFVRKREVHQAETSVATIIAAAISFVEHEAGRSRIRLDMECEQGTPPVLADFVAIEQVILNLVRNAFDALKLSQDSDKRVTVRAARYGESFVRVDVQDNGPGIVGSVAARLFEPFVTTKEDGMGLGLSICRGIVTAHGGLIEVESTERGCVAWFTLPVVNGRPSA